MTEHDAEDKKALGARIAAARKLKHWKQDYAAAQLGITKAALSAWETGRNLPDALMLKRLSKLYGIGVDSLLWENAITTEAMGVAAQYDALNERQRRTFMAMWVAYISDAASDEQVEKALPAPPADQPEKSIKEEK